eukprot:16346-Heterococcus_DN1.PRE.3
MHAAIGFVLSDSSRTSATRLQHGYNDSYRARQCVSFQLAMIHQLCCIDKPCISKSHHDCRNSTTNGSMLQRVNLLSCLITLPYVPILMPAAATKLLLLQHSHFIILQASSFNCCNCKQCNGHVTDV